MTEGFYLVDIINHLTDEWTIKQLKAGERTAMAHCDFNGMTSRLRTFRNALVYMSLHETPPLSLVTHSTTSSEVLLHEKLRVLIVDCSAAACSQHRALVLQCVPSAQVFVCHSLGDALKHKSLMDERGLQLHLVLTNLDLMNSGDPTSTISAIPSDTELKHILAHENGFELARMMDEPAPIVRKDFLFKPFVAMVTEHYNVLQQMAAGADWMRADGSVKGCDALVEKPLAHFQVRALLQSCIL